MRKCHSECLYFSSYSSKAVHFHPAHTVLQSVHRVIEIVWYIPCQKSLAKAVLKAELKA